MASDGLSRSVPPRRQPQILVTPLSRVKGQCAFLAGHGIQGQTLAKALSTCRGLVLLPREHLAQTIGYLCNELGCTAKASQSPKTRTCSMVASSEQCSPALDLPRKGLFTFFFHGVVC